MDSNTDKKTFPREDAWLLFLVMGFLGSLTIAREDIVIVYQGRASGQHAVLIGYLLAGIATVGLFKFYRSVDKWMSKARNVSRFFWLIYALCVATPFIFNRLACFRSIEGFCLILTAAAIAVFGHFFYSKLKAAAHEE